MSSVTTPAELYDKVINRRRQEYIVLKHSMERRFRQAMDREDYPAAHDILKGWVIEVQTQAKVAWADHYLVTSDRLVVQEQREKLEEEKERQRREDENAQWWEQLRLCLAILFCVCFALFVYFFHIAPSVDIDLIKTGVLNTKVVANNFFARHLAVPKVTVSDHITKFGDTKLASTNRLEMIKRSITGTINGIQGKPSIPQPCGAPENIAHTLDDGPVLTRMAFGKLVKALYTA
ncbi:hypothetical protein PRZ48_006067 [Zasmidium cellare]|uniref:Transmembrane protein n=1 Tax=Zasmidium cellare TaxID=395010 RepID=A0ABR0ENB7_ZASCE|nr:hypothetical protein PRZ48_006067 [Zasmidium cellare]